MCHHHSFSLKGLPPYFLVLPFLVSLLLALSQLQPNNFTLICDSPTFLPIHVQRVWAGSTKLHVTALWGGQPMSRFTHLLPSLLPAELLQPGPPWPAAGHNGPARLCGPPGWMRLSPGYCAPGGSAVHAFYMYMYSMSLHRLLGSFTDIPW